MNISSLINKAIKKQPPKKLLDYCGQYYSSYYYLMFLLAEEIGTGVLVELGVHKGRGIMAMALASLANTIIGIDTVKEQNLESKFPNFIFLNQPSLPVPDLFDINGLKINLLHIDTEHSFSMAKAEFEAYQPYFNDKAIILFDDLHAQGDSVKEYFLTLPYEKWENEKLHPSCGYGVLLYREDK